MTSLRSRFSGVRPLAVALVTAVVAFAAGPATAGAAADSADLATTISNVRVFSSVATFTVTVTNNGPSTAQSVTITGSWYGGGGFWVFAGLTATAGVSCTTPPIGIYPLEKRVVTCSTSSLGSGQSVMLNLRLNPTLFTGRGGVTDTATAASATPDPNSTNNTASFTATTA
jgi:hypothetical protein